MDKLILYVLLFVLLLVWVWIFAAAGPIQPILLIITICGVAVGSRCPRTREGR